MVRAGFPFNYDTRGAEARRSAVSCGPGRTQQQFKDECDINTIVKRFRLTGQVPVMVRVPQYGDFDTVTDFKSAMDAVSAARDSFLAMPAEVRARFKNDPGEFVEFCSVPENLPEMVKLGLAVSKKPDGTLFVDNEAAEQPKAPKEPSKPA